MRTLVDETPGIGLEILPLFWDGEDTGDDPSVITPFRLPLPKLGESPARRFATTALDEPMPTQPYTATSQRAVAPVRRGQRTG